MRFLSLIVVAVLVSAWFVVPTAHATGVPPVVNGVLQIGGKGQSLILESVTIASDGELDVLPGTTLLMAPAARIFVQGVLTLGGIPSAPVTVIALNSSIPWLGIESDCQSQLIAMTNTILSQFSNGISLCAVTSFVRDVTFKDSERESLDIREPVGTTVPIDLIGLQFDANDWGIKTESLGVSLEGSFEDISFGNIQFPPETLIPQKLKSHLITVTATDSLATLHTVRSGMNCDLAILSVPTPFIAGIPSDGCPRTTTPVIFIPGYGTSINLSVLTNTTSSEPKLDGWHFLSLVTPEYSNLLAWLHTNNIPTEVAYYDWRLPAAMAVREYLLPVIAAVKAKYHTDTVNIISHSFGGIVARSYIEGSGYAGDVSHLVEIATPNEGSAKAYTTWEGGSLPSDWQALDSLLRLYQYQHRDQNLSLTQVVQTYFPSVREMLPTYQYLVRGTSIEPVQDEVMQNSNLLFLNAQVGLLERRTHVITVASNDQTTPDTLGVGDPQSGGVWSDGEPNGFTTVADGDGTVLQSSAEAIDGERIHVSGSHLELVSAAIQPVLTALYPDQQLQKPYVASSIPRETTNILWFTFDCPVTVTIQMPSGQLYHSSNQEDGSNIENSDDLLWMLVPKEPGSYVVTISALADTPVRWWVNDEQPQELLLQKGESKSFVYPLPSAKAEMGASTAPFIHQSFTFQKIDISLSQQETPQPMPGQRFTLFKITSEKHLLVATPPTVRLKSVLGLLGILSCVLVLLPP